MIEIKNINISYNSYKIIENSEITILDGVMTGISGSSGSGKTTLFYIIGLISMMRGYDYFYNGHKLDIDDDKYKSSMRKHKIGFVFQDKNLHEYLSIEDNMKMYCYISGNEYTRDKAMGILKKVHIDLDISTLTRTLSGGEKQRLAIACALMKNPELIIADEPTSALDDENSFQVMRVLKELAKEGRMVIVASHNKDVLNFCHVQYSISDHKVICHGEVKKTETIDNKSQSERLQKFYSWYAKFSFGRSKVERMLTLFIPSLVISLCMAGLFLKDGLVKQFEGSLNETATNEVLVENRDQEISAQGLQLLKRIEGVKDINYIYSDFTENFTINNQLIKSTDITVLAYFDYQKEYFALEQDFEQGDIYLSYDLARKLEFKKTNDMILDADSLKEHQFKVAGIFEQSYMLTQSRNQNIIYIPVKYFNQETSNKVLINLRNFQYFDGISNKITTINQNFDVLLSQSKYLSQISFINMYRNNIDNFLIVLLTCTILLLLIMNFFVIHNQKYEIAVLKANGLSRNEIMRLMSAMTLRSVFGSIVMVGIMLGIESIFLIVLGIPSFLISFEMIGLTVLFVFIVYSIPNLFAVLYLNQFDPERIIRF